MSFWHILIGAILLVVGLFLCLLRWAECIYDKTSFKDFLRTALAMYLIFCGYDMVFESVSASAEKADHIRFVSASYLASSETAVFFEDDTGHVLAIDPDNNEYTQMHAYMFMYDTMGTLRETDDELIVIWQTVNPQEEPQEDY